MWVEHPCKIRVALFELKVTKVLSSNKKLFEDEIAMKVIIVFIRLIISGHISSIFHRELCKSVLSSAQKQNAEDGFEEMKQNGGDGEEAKVKACNTFMSSGFFINQPKDSNREKSLSRKRE
jgi:hypothetical protein